MRLTSWALLALPALLDGVAAVKQEDFKLCSQSSFCRRLRSIGQRQSAAPAHFTSPYSVGPPATTAGTIDYASWSWPVSSSLYAEISFELRVDILEKGDGIARIRMDEVNSQTPFRRYNETAKWALVDVNPPLASLADARLTSDAAKSTITYAKGLSIEIIHSPLKITQYRDGRPQVVFNERSLLHMEHFRQKQVEKVEEGASESEQMVLQAGEMDRSWFEEVDAEAFEERWKKWTDLKPKGNFVPCLLSHSHVLISRPRGVVYRSQLSRCRTRLWLARTRLAPLSARHCRTECALHRPLPSVQRRHL